MDEFIKYIKDKYYDNYSNELTILLKDINKIEKVLIKNININLSQLFNDYINLIETFIYFAVCDAINYTCNFINKQYK